MSTLAIAPAQEALEGSRFRAAATERESRASSIDIELLEQLRLSGLSGRVHSVFDRAVNVVTRKAGMMTLACSAAGNGPGTILIDSDCIPPGLAQVGDPVHVDARRVLMRDGYSVILGGAKPWLGRLQIYPTDTAKLGRNVRTSRALLRREGRPGGLLAARTHDNRFSRMASRLLQREARGLSSALRRGDRLGIAAHTRGMMGLGPGLTPSGDDHLVGVLAALNVPGHPDGVHLRAMAAAIDGNAGTTNDISFAALSRAIAGRVPERTIDFIASLMRGSDLDVAATLRRVLQIGSCSGTDIATGVLSAFAAWADTGLPGSDIEG